MRRPRIITFAGAITGALAVTTVIASPAHAIEIVYNDNHAAVADYNRSNEAFRVKDIATDGRRAVAWLYGTRPGGAQDSWYVQAIGYGEIALAVAPLKNGTLATIKVCTREGASGTLYGCNYHNFTA